MIVIRGLIVLFAVSVVMFLFPSRLEDIPTTKSEPKPGPMAAVMSDRNPKWAHPLEGAGLDNFHRVSSVLYRGAQPEAVGYSTLRERGVKSIINLRQFHSGRDEAAAAGLNYHSMYVNTLNLEDKEIHGFLKAITDPEQLPIFVHCKHGADRTGTMCAIYRIVLEGWSKEDAIKEMREGEFNFHEVFANLIEEIEDLDVEALRRQYAAGR